MDENAEAPDPAEAAVLGHLDDLDAEYETVRIDPAYADTAEFCAHYGYALEDSRTASSWPPRTTRPPSRPASTSRRPSST